MRGAILLNREMSEVVLVKGWSKKAKWSFPRGKINKEERDLDCAIREVYEETGYDVKEAGLVDEDNAKYIDMALREQQMRLYVFRDVPMDTVFEPKTRKEISRIDWFKVSELAATHPKHVQNQQQVNQDALKASQFYMVAPFIRPLRQWIKQQRKLDQQGKRSSKNVVAEESEVEGLQIPNPMVYDDGMMTTDPEDDGHHFQRLLSGLQGPQQAAPEPVLQPVAENTADLSAQLKAMLSVGGPVAPPAQQQQPQGNPLMSALFGKQQPPQIPHTPLDQIQNVPPQAQTPHHHHPRPPPYSEMPPPPHFPLSPQHGPPPPHHFNQQHWQGPPPPQPFHGQIPHPHQHMPDPQHFQGPAHPQHAQQGLRGLFGQNIPLPPPPNQVSNPLQTGDPSFRSQFPQYNQAAPPEPMAKPPPQKLSSHAMNLLNVFKSPNTNAAQVAQPSPGHLPELAVHQEKPILPSQLLGGASIPQPERRQPTPPQIHQPQAQRSRNAHQDSLLNLFKSASTPANAAPSAELEPAELAAQPSPLVGRDQAVKPVGHKLSMRRLPNVNTSVSISPGTAQARGGGGEGDKDNLTSATVSGPLNAPDFHTVRKNQPIILPGPGRPIEMGNGVASPSPGSTPNVGGTGQVQIMQRPASGMRQTPPVPVHTVGQGLEMSAPRPFHPTSILRRSNADVEEMANAAVAQKAKPKPQPQQDEAQVHGQGRRERHPQARRPQQGMPMQSQSHAHNHNQQRPPLGQAQIAPQALPPTQANFDRRESGTAQQKNALLSLFASKDATARSPAEFPGSLPISAIPAAHGHGHGRASGIGSPVSPLPSHLPNRRQDTNSGGGGHEGSGSGNGRNDTTRSSRISSINSVPGDLPLPSGGLPANLNLLGGMPLTSAPAGIASTSAGAAGMSEHSQQMLNLFRSKPSPGGGGAVKRGSVVSEAGGQGGQSPVTPVEKNFLLGYLQGVVAKEGEKRKGSLR